MAERSGSSRILACILVGLGAFFIVAALLLPTYTLNALAKTPLDLEITTVAVTGPDGGEVLDAKTLTAPTGKAEVNKKVPLVSQRYFTVEDPADSSKMTVQAGSTLRRTDKQGDTGLLTASVDRVTIDRKSGMPVDDPIGSIQVQSDKPAEEVSHTGLQYRFPFDTEKKSYPYFDINVRESFDINFVEETEINGTKVYHFNQKIPAIDLSKVVNSPTNKLSLPADKWGVAGGQAPVTMTRWYTNERDIWIEPKTGTVIKGGEKPFQYYARSADKPEVTVLRGDLSYDENTIEAQIKKAKEGTDKLSLYGRTVPIILGILGVLSLIAGLVLGLRGGSDTAGPAVTRRPAGPGPGAANPAPAPGANDWTMDRTEEIPVSRPNLEK